jgi:hypothetical protein
MADRFGRFDQMDAGYWIYPFRHAGVYLVTCDAGRVDWDSPEGALLYGVAQMARHKFLTDMATHVSSGLLKAAREGRWIGKIPDAYLLDRDAGRLVPNPKRVPVVREAFTRFAAGESTTSIVYDFNRRGVPSPAGGKWGVPSLLRILRCETYLGRTVFGRVAQGKYRSVTAHGVRPRARGAKDAVNDRTDWVVHEDTHEALIDEHTFSTVQRLLADKIVSPKGKHEPFLMTGLAVCGRCKSRLTGQRRFPRVRVLCGKCGVDKSCEDRPGSPPRCKCGKTFRAKPGLPQAWFVCSGRSSRGPAECRYCRIAEEELWYAVAEVITTQVLDPLKKAGVVKEVERLVRASARVSPAQLQKLRNEITALDRKIAQGAERYISCPAHMTAAVAAKVEELKNKRAERAEELRRLASGNLPGNPLARGRGRA